jgi:eukaryotic-like serine/threonine-protein kinase
MNKDKDADLGDIAAQVADRVPVDWPEKPDETSRRVLANLRTLDEIGAVYAKQSQSEDPTTLRVRPESPSMEPARPLETWGNLIIHGYLQRGGFGEVFRAYDPDLKKYVALKFPRGASNRQDAFIREAQRLAKVRHENVLTVHGVARHNGKVGIWTDLIEGSTIEERLQQQGILGAQEAAHIGVEICRALAAVHQAGLIHVDVKTSNVMREVGGKYVLMDFGAATRAPSEEQAAEDPLTGTPLFMAPELLRGNSPSVPTDIYALGVVLFRLVSLRYPIEGGSLHQVAESHHFERSLRLRDVRPDLPAGFVQVVEKALAADPARRYRTAGEMESALLHFLSPGVERRVEPVKPSRLERGLLVGVGALALTLVGSIAYDTLARFDVEASLFRVGPHAEERLNSGSRIAPGEQLFVEIKGSRKMHVYVLDQDEKGQAFLLFPLAGLDRQNPLRGDRVHRLPGTLKGTPNYWDVTSAGGEEVLVIVASRQPVPDIEAIRKRLTEGGANGPVEISSEEAIRIRGMGKMSPRPTSNEEVKGIIQGLDTRSSKEKGLWVFEFRLPNPSP